MSNGGGAMALRVVLACLIAGAAWAAECVWTFGAFSDCSLSCGGGVQFAYPSCVCSGINAAEGRCPTRFVMLSYKRIIRGGASARRHA